MELWKLRLFSSPFNASNSAMNTFIYVHTYLYVTYVKCYKAGMSEYSGCKLVKNRQVHNGRDRRYSLDYNYVLSRYQSKKGHLYMMAPKHFS